ncbi:MAG TPA: hypothetical protein VMT54_21200 [Candidatus Cybelea sp.]|nr:hypothetical protein [Candidatus Cybelea sp.]
MLHIESPPRLEPAAGGGDLRCLAGHDQHRSPTGSDQGTPRPAPLSLAAANVQQAVSGGRKTSRERIAELAKFYRVSERLIWQALELRATGRADLVAEAEAGRLKIRAALLIAKPRRARASLDVPAQLRSAWSRASDDERRAFLAEIAE